MTQQYWVRGPTGQSGPFDQLQIRGLVAIGELMPTMEISSDAREWRIASSVRGLFPEPRIDPMEAFSASAATSKVPGSAAQPSAVPVRPPPPPEVKPTPTASAAVNTAAAAPESKPATKPLSDNWQAIFAAFDKAGGLRFTNVRDLSSTELRYVTFNPWAFVFGPFWYFAKGMWKRGLTIQFFVWAALLPLAVALVELLPKTLQVSSQLDKAIPITAGAIFAAFANRDYYKLMRLGWRPSWKWLGISFATLILVGGVFFLMPDEWTPRTSGLVVLPQRASTPSMPATRPASVAAPASSPTAVASAPTNDVRQTSVKDLVKTAGQTNAFFSPFLNPNQKITQWHCKMGSCAWTKWIAVTVERATPSAVVVKAVYVDGASDYTEGDSSEVSDSARITWAEKASTMSFNCSHTNPSVTFSGEPVIDLPLHPDGVSAATDGAIGAYFVACHSEFGNLEQAIRKYAYNVQDS